MKKVQHAFAVVVDAGGPPAPSSRALEEAQGFLVSAFEHHQRGALGQAAAGYQAALEVCPTHPDALHLLGVVAHQLGDHSAAAQLISASLQVQPTNSDALSNLGNALLAQGDVRGAEDAYRGALLHNPMHGDALYNLANVLLATERPDEALDYYDAASAVMPGSPAIQFNRANLLQQLERYEEAVTAYSIVHAIDPDYPSLNTNRGAAYAMLKRWDDALNAFQTEVAATPNDPSALHNLGCVLNRMGLYREAAPVLKKALALQPESADTRRQLVQALVAVDVPTARTLCETAVTLPEAEVDDWYLLGVVRHQQGQPKLAIQAFEVAMAMDADYGFQSFHLGASYAETGQLDRAEAFYHEIIRRQPENGDLRVNLGLVLKDKGDMPRALEVMREGVVMTNDAESHSNYIFSLCYSDEVTADEILAESEYWASRHTPTVPDRPRLRNPEGRKIRVGYLSADFHQHPAGYLYRALFPLHDKERYEVVIFANQTHGDEVSAEIFASADRWHMVKGYSDAELADLIRKEEIDILVDLLGHTNNHRLKAFGLRPAPIQATWIGYFGTTGMRQMDYILCDRYTVPTAEERLYTERPARLPNCMYVFQPPQLDIEVGEPPMLTRGYPTFGCLNNTAKITPEVVRLWAKVLRALPHSRMILNRWPFGEASVRERYLSLFEANGVSRERIEVQATQGREAYFRSYREIDVVLDTFPFGGGTTTSESLWMGVPVVSLPAPRFVGHMTETVLRAVGADELLVTNEAEYIALATELASDPDRLLNLRGRLRGMVEGSPLCDIASFARDLEATYEKMLAEAPGR